MVTDSQAAHVIALVKERHAAVKQAFDGLLNAFAHGDMAQIVAANERLRSALSQLRGVVAAAHHPAWLQDLTANVERYATKHQNGVATWRAHLESALRNASALNDETWSFSEQQEILFDIDAIVAKARQDHQIDALYGRVIQTLEALLKSDEIDSIKAAADLSRLIATLQQAKTGTFSSQVFSWQFARRLVPNIISAYVRRSDITGPLVEAFEQTAAELDVSLDAAKDQIGEGILSAAAEALRTGTSASITHEAILFLESSVPSEKPNDGDSSILKLDRKKRAVTKKS
jgi:hypothetical protein